MKREKRRYVGIDLGKRTYAMAVIGKSGKVSHSNGRTNSEGRAALYGGEMCDKKIIRHIPLKLDMNPYIDREYFHKRRYRLLVNRTLGLNLENKQSAQTVTGNHPADGCLHEA
jgi:hypothetical protein